MIRGILLLWVALVPLSTSSSLLDPILDIVDSVFIDSPIGDTTSGTTEGTAGGTDPDSPPSAGDLLHAFNAGDEDDKELGDVELLLEATRVDLTKDLPPETCEGIHRHYHFVGECNETDARYRRLDGACNNLENKNWGKAKWPFLRLLEPDYADGLSEKRRHATEGSELPNPRVVSRTVGTKAPREGNDPFGSMAMAIMGQFLDHDITLAPKLGADCTKCPTTSASSCCPFKIDENDEFYKNQTTCMELPRSIPVPAHVCPVDPEAGSAPREHINDLTAYIDASAVYGVTEEHSNILRDDVNTARMKTLEQQNGLRPLLPEDLKNKDCVGKVTSDGRAVGCGLAGDERAAEQPTLTAFHLLFVRFHNVVEEELRKLNPHWDDERRFQETRKIISACFQHIVYNEYLPAILGHRTMEKFNLKIRKGRSGYKGYDPNISATISNVFAAAAFRYGHTQIMFELDTLDDENFKIGTIPLHRAFFNASVPHDTTINGINGLVLGNINQRLNKIDRHFSEAIQGRLFQEQDKDFGFDLVAINIQRGREHGIPSYAEYYELCNPDDSITSMDKLESILQEKSLVHDLKKLYGVHGYREIDPFVGFVTEKHVTGGRVGRSLACLLGDQFSRIKHGDRFWYERQEPEGFSDKKLAAIKKLTFSRLICDTLDNSENLNIQPYALYTPTCDTRKFSNKKSWADYTLTTNFPSKNLGLPRFSNHRVSCSDEREIPKLELWAWKESKEDTPSANDLLAFNNEGDKNDEALEALETTIEIEQKAGIEFELPIEVCENISRLYILVDDCNLHANDGFDKKYRRLDGGCNNLDNPNWGKAQWPLVRLAEPVYADGISAKRRHGNVNSVLPNPRDVSRTVGTKAPTEGNDPFGSMALAIYGQVLDHDITHAPQHKGNCTVCTGKETSNCCPISIDQNDEFYKNKLTCMELPRTIGVPGHVCSDDPVVIPSKAPRDHINTITSYIDASFVYGSDKTHHEELREVNSSPRLKVLDQPNNLLPFLPEDKHNEMCRNGTKDGKPVSCALAGDERAAEQPTLTAYHTLFMRFHNNIVDELEKLNPKWGVERLFEEARKIVSACLQHITYNEYLPAILGAREMKRHNLKIRKGRDHYLKTGYNKTLSATISNEFAAAVFRYGHTQIMVELETRDNKYNPLKAMPLHEAFFNALALHDDDRNGLNGFVLGNINQRVNKIDRHFSQAIQGRLFQELGKDFGLDLIAINIQRAREHGIPSYAEYYELCHPHEPSVTSWKELENKFQEEPLLHTFKELYGEDGFREIDLFMGLVTEKHVRGGRVGPTLACMLGDQFRRLRYGDRFWYERPKPEGFSDNQLAAIKKVTFSRVLCDTLDNGDHLSIQPYALYCPDTNTKSNSKAWADYTMETDFPGSKLNLPNFSNHRVSCKDTSQIPKLNLAPWKDHSLDSEEDDSEVDTVLAEETPSSTDGTNDI